MQRTSRDRKFLLTGFVIQDLFNLYLLYTIRKSNSRLHISSLEITSELILVKVGWRIHLYRILEDLTAKSDSGYYILFLEF